MAFWNKFCGFVAIFLMWVLYSGAQSNKIYDSVSFSQPNLYKTVYQPNSKEPIVRKTSIIPQNYYTQHLGIICKKELAIEKHTKIPFRFRLGSLQQCNYLEGKR